MYVIPKEGYLIQAKISLAEELEAEAGSCWIEMREPSTQDFVKLQQAGESGDLSKQMAAYAELFPKLVIDHDFCEELPNLERRKLTAPELIVKIGERADLFLALVRKYSEAVLFTRGKKLGAR